MDALEQSFAYAEKISRSEAKNFFYTFRFLPPERRRAIYVVYTYSRRLDDAVDSVAEKSVDPETAAKDLDRLATFISSAPPDDPLVPSLRDTIERFSIPLFLFEELIEGMRMDIRVQRFQTFDDLYLYCFRAAAVVGLICIEIFGHEEGAEGPAEALGIAMQLTNILRDVAEDLGRGRIYLPLADLERFGYSEEDLKRRVVDDRFRALMEFEVRRAREYFERAEELFPLVRPESRYCPILLKRLYSRILDRIERQKYDVFSRRPQLPLHQKLWAAALTWMDARRDRR